METRFRFILKIIMDKKDFIQLAHEVFKPLGYKRRNSNWSSETSELIRAFNLQKSMYGNLYYLNYGFIIKGLELRGLYDHVGGGFCYKDNEKRNHYMHKLLDCENDIPDEKRRKELRHVLEDLEKQISEVRTVDDVRQFIADFNMSFQVPVYVCEYLGIERKRIIRKITIKSSWKWLVKHFQELFFIM